MEFIQPNYTADSAVLTWHCSDTERFRGGVFNLELRLFNVLTQESMGMSLSFSS